jgi:CRP/FNR family transcriptional regulator, polysaccharide utilization system transcription regulator
LLLKFFNKYFMEIQYDIHHFTFGSYLSPDEQELVMANSNLVKYNKNDNIFLYTTRTSHVMYLKSGLVKIFKESRQSKNNILKVEKSNSFIGLMSIFGYETHQYSGTAIEPTEVLFIDIQVFKNLIKQNGQFAQHIIHTIALDGLYVFDKLICQTYKQLPGRVADVILYFSEKIYENETFIFPMSRRELAEFAGTTKESFIRTLTEFKNDKIIELDGSKVTIKSMKIIKTLSELG